MKNSTEIEIFKNVELKNFCTFKIGGKAKYIFIVHSINALSDVLSYCKTHNIKNKIIGFGANLLFDDNGFDGAIIVNKSNKILVRKNCVYADSGVAVSALISASTELGLAGLEKLVGIPSSAGGAVVNGLGAFGVEFNNFVEYVICLNENGKVVKLKNSACEFGYRTSKFRQKHFVILRVKLKLSFGSKKTIKANMLAAIKQKSATQPLNYPSAGSVFKRFFVEKKVENKIKNNNSYKDKIDRQDNFYENKQDNLNYENKQENLNYQYNNSSKLYKIDKNSNCNDYKNKENEKSLLTEQLIVPAKIIDELGLKGLSVGGAMVSTKHAGFIVNTGNATSKDVKRLIDIINQKVQAAYGFALPLEIEIVNPH